jgi:membrane-associated phospholipid phosphatase
MLRSCPAILLILPFFLFFYKPLSAQPDSLRICHPAACNVSLNMDYVKKYYTDTKAIFLAPLSWDKTNWITAALVVGTTGGLYAADEKIKEWTQEHANNATDDISVLAKIFGDGRYTLPPLALYYTYGQVFHDQHARCTALLSLESYLVSNIFIQSLKFGIHRHRPHTGAPPDTWDEPSLSMNNLSFPSGHSNAAFSIATVIAYEYQDQLVVPVICYTIATLTALSRVNDNDHWASDIFFGSATGFFTGRAIYKMSHCATVKNISLELEQNKLALAYRF